MTGTLAFAVVVLVMSLCAMIILHMDAKKRLVRYRAIQDAEAYEAKCQLNAKSAIEQAKKLATQLEAANQRLSEQKNRVAQYQQLLGKFQTAADLHHRIEVDEARIRQLSASLSKLENASQLDAFVQSLEVAVAQRQTELNSLADSIGSARTVGEIAAQATYYENYVAQLKAEVEAVEEAKELQEFGFYRPRYSFESSDLYKSQLEQIRWRQKSMLSSKTACLCNTEWTVDGGNEAHEEEDGSIRRSS